VIQAQLYQKNYILGFSKNFIDYKVMKGLGLSLVEGHEGKIFVKNKMPHGSEFSILLPY